MTTSVGCVDIAMQCARWMKCSRVGFLVGTIWEVNCFRLALVWMSPSDFCCFGTDSTGKFLVWVQVIGVSGILLIIKKHTQKSLKDNKLCYLRVMNMFAISNLKAWLEACSKNLNNIASYAFPYSITGYSMQERRVDIPERVFRHPLQLARGLRLGGVRKTTGTSPPTASRLCPSLYTGSVTACLIDWLVL